jgi:hypothetical protein
MQDATKKRRVNSVRRDFMVRTSTGRSKQGVWHRELCQRATFRTLLDSRPLDWTRQRSLKHPFRSAFCPGGPAFFPLCEFDGCEG